MNKEKIAKKLVIAKVKIDTIANEVKPINLGYVIKDQLLGHKYSHSHKIGVGIGIMVIGVIVSKIHVEFFIFHYIFDGLGYGIHGLGLTPIVEYLGTLHRPQQDIKHDIDISKNIITKAVDEVKSEV